jgi:hypothetical protein
MRVFPVWNVERWFGPGTGLHAQMPSARVETFRDVMERGVAIVTPCQMIKHLLFENLIMLKKRKKMTVCWWIRTLSFWLQETGTICVHYSNVTDASLSIWSTGSPHHMGVIKDCSNSSVEPPLMHFGQENPQQLRATAEIISDHFRVGNFWT